MTAQELEGLKQWGSTDSMLECPFHISGAIPNTRRVGKRNSSRVNKFLKMFPGKEIPFLNK